MRQRHAPQHTVPRVQGPGLDESAWNRRLESDVRLKLGVAALVVLVALALLVWLVRRLEPRLAFFPFARRGSTPRSSGVAFTAAHADDRRRRAPPRWHLPRPDARAQVVYFHGNGGNLSLWTDILVDLWRQGFDVIAVDYRGYGLSTGRRRNAALSRRRRSASLSCTTAAPPGRAADLLGAFARHGDGRVCGQPARTRRRRARGRVSRRCARSSRPIR